MTSQHPSLTPHTKPQEAKRAQARENLEAAQAEADEPPHSPRATARNLSFGREHDRQHKDDDNMHTVSQTTTLNILLVGAPRVGSSTLAAALREGISTKSKGAIRAHCCELQEHQVAAHIDAQHDAYLRCGNKLGQTPLSQQQQQQQHTQAGAGPASDGAHARTARHQARCGDRHGGTPW